MRALLVLSLLSACGGGESAPIDPHELVACDDAWLRNGFTECEAACADSTIALTAAGPACEAHSLTGPVSCSKTFVFDGVTGCCASAKPRVAFAACD